MLKFLARSFRPRRWSHYQMMIALLGALRFLARDLSFLARAKRNADASLA